MGINHLSEKVVIFRSMFYGLIAFMVGSVLASIIVMFWDNYILALAVAGGAGGALMGLLLHYREKIIRMLVSGIVGMPIALMLSFLIVEGIGGLLPFVGHYFENTIVPDVTAVILLGIFFGGIFGGVVLGRKAISLFIITCGAVSFPSGLVVGALNSSNEIQDQLLNGVGFIGKIDLNLLSIIIFLGLGIGLSVGLYQSVDEK